MTTAALIVQLALTLVCSVLIGRGLLGEIRQLRLNGRSGPLRS